MLSSEYVLVLDCIGKNLSCFIVFPVSKVELSIAFYMVFVWSSERKLKILGHGGVGEGIQHSSFFGLFCCKLMRADKKEEKKLWKEICPNFVVVVALQNTKLFWQNEDSVIRAKNRKQ